MHARKLLLGLVVVAVGAVGTPVGAQAAAEGFLALQGVQAESLSDQEMEAVRGKRDPFVVVFPNTTCTTGCDGLPVSGFVCYGVCTDDYGHIQIIGGETVADTTSVGLRPGEGLNISSGGVVAIPPPPPAP